MVGWRRRPRWVPAEEPSIDSNFVQASKALDLAAQIAIDKGNADGLVNAAHGWLRMVETYVGIPPHMVLSEGGPGEDYQETGFRGKAKEEDA